jgi:hypothetical protein
VRIEGNLFARNAGSAIEFLAIEVAGRPTRPEDHAIEHVVADNGFWDDVRKDRPERPSEQRAALHYRNDTRSPMSGRTGGNLYAERTGFVDVVPGHEIGDWVFGDDLEVDPTTGVACFADMPGAGAGAWSAGVVSEGGDWRPFEARSPMLDRWGDEEGYVERFAMLPVVGRDRWTARRWVAPRDGRVAVRGVAVRHHPGGVPTLLRITNQGVQIWPETGEAILDEMLPEGARPRLDGLPVRAGDTLRFEVQALGARSPVDVVSWSPLIGFVAAEAPTTE